MRLFTLVLLYCIVWTSLSAQEDYISSVSIPDSSLSVVMDEKDPSVRLAKSITVEDLKTHLYTLASDDMEGRETGHPGNDKAADYLRQEIKRIGLQPVGTDGSFFQDVAFSFTSWNSTEMYVGEEKYKHLWDYLCYPSRNEHMPLLETDEIVYLGYGIDDNRYSDYRDNPDVEGKVALIYKGEPTNEDGNSQLTQSKTMSAWSDDDMRMKLIVAKRRGVKLVLVIEENIKDVLMENRRLVMGGQTQLTPDAPRELRTANHALISTNIAQALIGSEMPKIVKARDKSKKRGKGTVVELKAPFKFIQDKKERLLEGRNVMGYIEGTDKSDELLILSAHYDHVGKKGEDVFNGADDNASGTSTVLELAEAYQKAKEEGHGPRRSILFMWLTGEEKGLLGSAYYTDHPIFPIKQTIANVNMDMLGRVDKKYEGNPNYVYVIGSDRLSTDLHKINEVVNQKYTQLTLDYTYNAESDPNRFYYRSDHYNFAKHGIPAIFFFNGTHEDYHRPSDTPDKINYEKLAIIGKHIFHMTWELAHRNERIRVDRGEAVKITP